LFKNVFKSLALPELNPTARVASLLTGTFNSLTYVGAKSYGARRVILSPPAIEAQNSFFFFFLKSFALHFCCHLKDLLFL
jgi:hypothetical protein